MTESQQKSLGELLVEEELITRDQLREAKEHQQITGKTLCRTLIDLGYLSDNDKNEMLKARFGIETMALHTERLTPETLKLIPRREAVRHHAVAVKMDGQSLVVAMEEPQNVLLVDYLKTLTGHMIKPMAAKSDQIMRALEEYPLDDRRFDLATMPLAMRLLVNGVLFVVYMLPFLLFILVLVAEGERAEFMKDLIRNASVFERALFLGLSWGVWALVIFEISGLLLRDSRTQLEE